MITKVFDYVQKYQMIEEGDTIAAGVSGGADSVCLLFVLLRLREKIPFRLAVVHVNHGIREDAGRDADYVKRLCEENNLPFYLTEINIKDYAGEYGLSEEEAGRKVRYQAFREALLKENAGGRGKIAVAHNSNDRGETMLFHLFRGTGLTGAGGIKPVSGNVIRPLLCLERKEIEGWLKEQHISYQTDSTNYQDIYTRNRIRHHILPYAEENICSGVIAHMSQAGDNLLEAEEFIVRQTDLAKKRCVVSDNKQGKDGITIILPEFKKEDSYLQGRILLSCLEEIAQGRKDITSNHISSIRKLFVSDGCKEIHLPYGITVYKKYDVGMIDKGNRRKGRENTSGGDVRKEYEVPIPGSLFVPGLGAAEITVFSYEKCENIPKKTYTKWFDYDKITKSIAFRIRRKGDFLTINERMGHKSLQDYFVNEKIPKAERDSFYVLAEGSHIMWVPGHRISEYYKVSETTLNILQVKINKKNL